jgi:hypothetical protein
LLAPPRKPCNVVWKMRCEEVEAVRGRQAGGE